MSAKPKTRLTLDALEAREVPAAFTLAGIDPQPEPPTRAIPAARFNPPSDPLVGILLPALREKDRVGADPFGGKRAAPAGAVSILFPVFVGGDRASYPGGGPRVLPYDPARVRPAVADFFAANVLVTPGGVVKGAGTVITTDAATPAPVFGDTLPGIHLG
jgi:hypothetical protein